ncbi:hypothetical protein [Clostridium butyricum]|uniref:hypothetical protein n=1 Tax=Clostridium butyricum TaxID=1492 RepID=UPI002ABE6267|nr:hypothetical protein [Clostridium butyricum]
MSRGLEAVFRLLVIEDDKAIYAYSGENFSFQYDKELTRSYDGRIEILLSAFDDIDSYDLFEKEKVKNCKRMLLC